MRIIRLAAVGVIGALLIDGAFLAWMSWKRSAPRPTSVLFTSSRTIRDLQAIAEEQPHDPELRIRLGEAYLKEGHFLSSLASFEAALHAGGSENLVRRAKAVCYSNLTRHDDALKELKRLATLVPRDLGVRLQISAEYAALGKPKEARSALDTIPRNASGLPDMDGSAGVLGNTERLGVAYGQIEQWPQSLRLAQYVLQQSPDNAAAHVVAGRALQHLGRTPESIEHFRVALKSNVNDVDLKFFLSQALLEAKGQEADAEIRDLLESVAQQPSQWRGRASFSLGEIYERKRDWARAAEAYMTAYTLRTRAVPALRMASVNFSRAGNREQAIYTRGLTHETQGRFDEAVGVYVELTRVHSSCQSGYMHVARVQGEMGQPRAALATLEKARRASDPPPKLFTELARAYGAVKDLPNQQAMWREFIRRDPENADVGYQNLGAIADSGGNLDEAEKLYRKCIELQPSADLYRVRLARTLLQRRSDPARMKEAIKHLERAVVMARDDAEAYFHLGVAYRFAKRPQEAIWSMRHAIDLDPGNGAFYQPMGELLISAGQHEEGKRTLALFRRYREFHQAWETLRVRANREPADANLQRRLAEFYDRAGAPLDAITAYARVLELHPNDGRARKRLIELYREVGQDEKDLQALGNARSPEKIAP